jgi:hypothetical protein
MHKVKTKKATYKGLLKASVIADSEIPAAQQSKVFFTLTYSDPNTIDMTGMIKGLPMFRR